MGVDGIAETLCSSREEFVCTEETRWPDDCFIREANTNEHETRTESVSLDRVESRPAIRKSDGQHGSPCFGQNAAWALAQVKKLTVQNQYLIKFLDESNEVDLRDTPANDADLIDTIASLTPARYEFEEAPWG